MSGGRLGARDLCQGLVWGLFGVLCEGLAVWMGGLVVCMWVVVCGLTGRDETRGDDDVFDYIGGIAAYGGGVCVGGYFGSGEWRFACMVSFLSRQVSQCPAFLLR